MEAMDWNDRPTIQVRVLLYQAPNLPGVHLPHLGGMLVRGEEKRNIPRNREGGSSPLR